MNRKDVALLGGLGAIATAGIVALVVKGGGLGGGSPLAAVPRDSFLVGTIDVREIALSPLAKGFVSPDGGARVPGMSEVEEVCGWNPLARVRQLAVAIPEGGEDGDFGIAASADLSRDELVDCAKKLVAKRGGDASVSTAGTFTVVADGRASMGGREAPKVAFRDGGPCLVGRGAWLTKMMDAAEGRGETIAANPDHATLRGSIEGRAHGSALVVTAVLARSLRDRIRAEMSLDDADAGPQAKQDKGASLMDGVLGVSSAGLAISAGTDHQDATLAVELHCETEAQCTAVRTLLLKQRLSLSGNFGVRLAGLGPLIDNFEATVTGPLLVATTHAPASDIASAVERALRPHPHAAPPEPPPSLAPPQITPDESLSAKRDASADAAADAHLALPASKP